MEGKKTSNTGLLIGLLCIIMLLIAIVGLMVVLLFWNSSKTKDVTEENTVTVESTKEVLRQSVTTEQITDREEPATAQESLDSPQEEITVELLSGELREIERILNSSSNYGFCQSEYKDYTNINWEMVFYCGAGIHEQNLSQNIINDYLAYVHEEELFTGLTAIRGDALEEFVKRTTGHPYKDAVRPLKWPYMSDYDMYFCEHGDTNYYEVSVINGERTGNEYTVRYLGYDENYEQATMEIKFILNGENCQFISNQRVE